MEVVRVPEQRREVAQADELGAQAEGVLQLERVPPRLRRRPEKEHQRDRDLRRKQRVRQPRRAEDDPLFHLALVRGLEPAQDLVAAPHGVVHGGLGVLPAREHRLHFLFDHFAALHIVAEAQAL